ncbi:MAG: hypothetical protein GVY36_01035 [Verrucomicrobia bacterium]|jgi:hypothetical protein|nr:hypothetical protein [Verrucomicrobiota bacterium]
MKTTLEVPDALYREVKSRAALRRRKIKDYVAEGLRLALEADSSNSERQFGQSSVFDEVRSAPLHSAEEVQAMIEQANLARRDAWRDEF